MDLRTQKVYDALLVTFQQLLEEKRFEEITVQELCDRAKTRRATFYKHFSDKYDFFQFMLTRLRDELLSDAKERMEDYSPTEYLHAFVDLGILFVERNKKLLVSLKDNDVVIQMLQTITKQTIHEQLFPFMIEDELALQFFIGGMNQCVRWWLDNMHTVQSEDMKKYMYTLVDKFSDAVS